MFNWLRKGILLDIIGYIYNVQKPLKQEKVIKNVYYKAKNVIILFLVYYNILEEGFLVYLNIQENA